MNPMKNLTTISRMNSTMNKEILLKKLLNRK